MGLLDILQGLGLAQQQPQGLLNQSDQTAQLPDMNVGQTVSPYGLSSSTNPLSRMYGAGGPGDPLIAMGVGLASAPRNQMGRGLATGLGMANQQMAMGQVRDLTNAQNQQKLQALQGNVATLKKMFPDKTDAEISAAAQNPDVMKSVMTTAFPAPTWTTQKDESGNPVSQTSVTGEAKAYPVQDKYKTFTGQDGTTFAYDPSDPNKQVIKLTPQTQPGHWAQPSELPQGAQPNAPIWIGPDQQPKGVGGGTVINNGPQADYNSALTEQLGKTHAALAGGVEGSQSRLRDVAAMQGALQRIQQAGGTTGFGQEQKVALQSAINSGANSLGLGEQFDISDPQLISKFNRTLAGQQAKDVGGARVTNFEMANFLKSNAGLELSPSANQRLLGIQGQIEQRNVDLGQQVRQMTADAVSQGRKVDPAQVENLIRSYDQQHHVTDPITGQDLTKSVQLPDLQMQPGASQQSGAPSKFPSWRVVQ